MKKLLLFGIMMFVGVLSASAQLGLPTTKVKDTFDISRVYYNGTELNRADWPDTMIVEDALNVYIANFVYVKGKLKKGYGAERHYDAKCNGETVSIVVERSMGGLGELSYAIGDYVFWVRTRQDGTEN